MKLKLLIVLVALVPTLVMAEGAHLIPVGSTGMPAVPTPQAVQNTVKADETQSSTSSMSPNNPITPTSSTCILEKVREVL